MLRSSLSVLLTYVKCKSERSASSSCEIPNFDLLSRNIFPAEQRKHFKRKEISKIGQKDIIV